MYQEKLSSSLCSVIYDQQIDYHL